MTYIYTDTNPITLPSSLARAGNDQMQNNQSPEQVQKYQMLEPDVAWPEAERRFQLSKVENKFINVVYPFSNFCYYQAYIMITEIPFTSKWKIEM